MNWIDKGDISYRKVGDTSIEIRVSTQEVVYMKDNLLRVITYPCAKTRNSLKKIVKEELESGCV